MKRFAHNLLAGAAGIAALMPACALAGAPTPPPEIQQIVSAPKAAAVPAAKPATPAAGKAAAPAPRAADANDEAAKLASEVPADEDGAPVKPADQWVSSTVGPIATRPVDPADLEKAKADAKAVADEPAAAAPASVASTMDGPEKPASDQAMPDAAKAADPAPAGRSGNPEIADQANGLFQTMQVKSEAADPSSDPAAPVAVPVAKVDQAALPAATAAQDVAPQKFVAMQPVGAASQDDSAATDDLTWLGDGDADAAQPKAEAAPAQAEAPAIQPAVPDIPKQQEIAALPAPAATPQAHETAQQAATRAKPQTVIVSISADFSKPNGNVGRGALPSRGGKSGAAQGAYALVYGDGDQHSGDTLIKFFRPATIWFDDPRSCMDFARSEGASGAAVAPSGSQPNDLYAYCIGSADGKKGEFWLWRKRSGAVTRSVLLPAQAEVFERVIQEWTANSELAYGEFPPVPIAGR